jgi:hypothetical protein
MKNLSSFESTTIFTRYFSQSRILDDIAAVVFDGPAAIPYGFHEIIFPIKDFG